MRRPESYHLLSRAVSPSTCLPEYMAANRKGNFCLTCLPSLCGPPPPKERILVLTLEFKRSSPWYGGLNSEIRTMLDCSTGAQRRYMYQIHGRYLLGLGWPKSNYCGPRRRNPDIETYVAPSAEGLSVVLTACAIFLDETKKSAIGPL